MKDSDAKIPKTKRSEKADFLQEFLEGAKFKALPVEIKGSVETDSFRLFLDQLVILMPDFSDSDRKEATAFCWRIFHGLAKLFIDDKILPPPRSKTEQTIRLVKKALKATQAAKANGEKNMFLPITSISQLETVEPYLGHFDEAERHLQIAVLQISAFKKWAYSSKHLSGPNRVLGLWMLHGVFAKYLGERDLKIPAVGKGSFEKSNTRNIYRATPLKLTTNAVYAVGLALPEVTIRKRLKAFGGPLVL